MYTQCQVCRVISEAVRLWKSCQISLWSQKSRDGGCLTPLCLSARPADRGWQWPEGLGELSTTSDLQLFPQTKSNLSTSTYAQPVPFYFLSYTQKTLMFGSGNQVCVWTEKAVKINAEQGKRGNSSVKRGEERLQCCKEARGRKWREKEWNESVKTLVLHSLVLRGAFWQEWQTIP